MFDLLKIRISKMNEVLVFIFNINNILYFPCTLYCTENDFYTFISSCLYLSDSVDINITLAVLKQSVNLIYMLDFSYFSFFFNWKSIYETFSTSRLWQKLWKARGVPNYHIPKRWKCHDFFLTLYNGQVTESSTLFRITWRRFCLLHTASTRPRSGSSWRTPTETAWCPGTSCSRSPWTSAWPLNRPQKPWICSIWLGTSTATGNSTGKVFKV